MDSEINRLRKKVENYPSPSAYTRLAELQRVAGDIAEATNVCRRCIKEFPRNGQAYVQLATIEIGNGNRGDAIKLLRESIANDPRCYAGFRMLADLCIEDRNLEQATSYLQKILEFKPQDTAVREKIDELQRRQAAGFEATPKPDDDEHKPDTDTIDLTSMGALTTATASTRPTAQSTRKPTPPSSAMTHSTQGSPLESLVAQDGVTGAVIVDDQGRGLSEQGLEDGKGDFLAALSNDVATAAQAYGNSTGSGRLVSFGIIADNGQAVAYRRENDNLMVAALADRKVKTALLELRARQALIDMGAN